MRSAGWRRVLVASGVLASLALLLLLLLHTGPARRSVVDWIAASLARSGIVLSVDRLDYNLIGGHATLVGVRLTARDRTDPFFTAERVRLAWPWGAVTGPLRLESVEITRGRFVSRRDEAGVSNLPGGEGSTSAEPATLPIGRLLADDFQILIDDKPTAVALELLGVRVDLSPAGGTSRGPVTLSSPSFLRWQDQRLDISRIGGQAGFDGRNVELDRVRLETSDGGVTLSGRIEGVLGEPRLTLRYEAALGLAALAARVSVTPVPGGDVVLNGEIGGAPGAPVVTARVTTRDARWPPLGPLALEANARLADMRLSLDALRATLGGGSIGGSAALSLNRPDFQAQLSLQTVDVGALLAALPTPPAVRLATAVSGSVNVQSARPSETPGGKATVDSSYADSIRTGSFSADLRMQPSGQGGGLALRGPLRVSAERGEWQAVVDLATGAGTQVAGMLRGRLAAPLTSSTVSGPLRLETPRLARALEELRAAGLMTARPPDVSSGRARAQLTIGGTVAEPILSGPVTADDVTSGTIGPASARAQLSYRNSTLTLTGAALALPEADVTGDVSVNLRTQSLGGSTSFALRSFPGWMPAPVPVVLGGQVEGTLSLSGPAAQPMATGTVRGGPLTIAGQPVERFDADVALSSRLVRIDRLDAAVGGGTVTAAASYEMPAAARFASAAGNRFALKLKGKQIRIDGLDTGGSAPIPFSGVVDLEFSGSGSVSDPAGSGRMRVAEGRYGDRSIGAADATFDLRDRAMIGRVSLPDLDARIDGRVSIAQPYGYTATVVLASADAADLFARIGVQPPRAIEGTISATINATGQLADPKAGRIDARIDRLDATVDKIPVTLTEGAGVRYAGGVLEASNVHLRTGETSVRLDGRLGSSTNRLALTIDGTLADLQRLATLVPGASAFVSSIGAAGAVRATLALTGTTERATVSGEVEVSGATVTLEGRPPLERVAAKLRIADGVATLDTLTAEWQGASIEARGTLPLRLFADSLPSAIVATLPAEAAPAALNARVTGLTERALAGTLDADTLAKLRGRVTATVSIAADRPSLDALRGSVLLEEAEFAVSGVGMTQRGPSRLEIADGRLQVRSWQWTGPATSLLLDGRVGLTGDRPLALAIGGEVDLRLLSLFLPVAAGGRARLTAGLGGSIADPRFEGEIAISNAEMRLAEPRLAVSGLTGTLQLTRDRLTGPKLAGFANGGPLTMAVDLRHANFAITSGTVTLSAANVPLEAVDGLRTEVDTDLRLEFTAGRPALRGILTVARGGYREPLTIVGQMLQRLRNDSLSAVPAAARHSVFDDMALDVAVVTREDVLVSNNVADLALSLDVRLVGTVARPGLLGRSAVREGGSIVLAGNVFQIETGSIDFSNPTMIEPQLNITAHTRINAEEVTLRVSGTPESLHADLTSDLGTSQGDLMTLLLTGRSPDEAGGGMDVARDQMLGYLTGEFLAVAGRAVGLDLVRFERGDVSENLRFDPGLIATETDPTTRLTIGKNIGRDVRVVFSQNLRHSDEATWIVSYTPKRNFEVRGVSRDNLDRSYEFRHDLTFGGRKTTRPAARSMTTAGHIGTVEISGAPEDEVRRRISVEEGDRFDFYRWQRDRDRLLEFYQDAGYRQAQVNVRRTVRPGAGKDGDDLVDLDYTIVRGPLAVLVVEGITLSSSLKRDLEEKWNEAVVDAFLIQEAETLIASHLAGLGHLRPTVRGESQLSEDRSRQTITLRVDPGPRVAQTVVRVTGAGEERQRQVEALAGPPEAWREIGPVRSAIRDWYHGNGWLDADVTVGEAVIDGTTATLPVTVTEGRQYHVAGAAVVTPVTRPSTEIEAAADLTAGAPFTPALIERTRRLVEVDYRRHGFNEARVIASAAPDAASATVTMNLSIEEGPQQVVGSVVLDPDMRTRDRLLARALAIQLNTPVSFEALYQGRQRAFATGVFRRIDFDVQPQGAATVDASGRTVQPVAVNVNVEEVPVYRLRYGFGLNEDRSFGESNQGRTFTPGAVGEFTRLNLFGRAITAGTSVRYERRQQILRGFLGVPRLFGLPISSHVFGSRQRNSIGEDTQRPAVRLVSQVSLEQRFRPLRHMQVSYGYIYERNRTNPVNFDPDDFTTFPVVVNVARLAASVAWDHRDDPFDATRGWFHGSTVEYSSERLGSVLRFSKYLGQGYYYRPVGPVVVASAVRFGVADAYGQVLIPSEKFQAGGGHSVRGYSEDAAGPSDFFGPTGGDALLVLNQEVRFPVWKWVRGVGFVDAGAAFADFAEMSFGGLAKSIGAGVRLDTPIGLFRLDYGVPLSTGFGDKRGRWFFAIGQMF